MATSIYLGNPPENIRKWIEENYKPTEPEETYNGPLCFTANNPGEGATVQMRFTGVEDIGQDFDIIAHL
jgi:hypothetical protein